MHLAAWMAAIVFGLGMVSSLEAGVWTNGHGDIDAHFHEADQALELGLHFHDGGVGAFGGGTLPAGHHEADEHQIFVPGAPITLPGTGWDFAGASGDSVWFLPPNNDPNKPYLGWGAEELPTVDWFNPTFTLLSVNGPAGGVFSVWATDSFGARTVKLSSVDGFSKSFSLPAGSHEHFTVGFNRAGTFDVSLRVSAMRRSDNQTFSGDGTFTFYVNSVPNGGEVPEPGSMAIFSVLAIGSGYRMLRRRKIS
jgi:hypothetical protein